MFKNKFYGKAGPGSYHCIGWAKQIKPSIFLPHFMEKAAMWGYTCYTSLECALYIIIIIIFKKACVSYATEIFEKIVRPKTFICAFNTFTCMIRKTVTCSFCTVEKQVETTRNLSSNVYPQIISNSVFPKSIRK